MLFRSHVVVGHRHHVEGGLRADAGGLGLALAFGQGFAVAQARDVEPGGQPHRRNDDRTGERTSPDLVHAQFVLKPFHCSSPDAPGSREDSGAAPGSPGGLTSPRRFVYTLAHAADIAQGLERLTVAEEVVGSRPIIRPKFSLLVRRHLIGGRHPHSIQSGNA